MSKAASATNTSKTAWMETTRTGRSVGVEIVAIDGESRRRKHDDVVGEEPLELRLSDGAHTATLAVTMRTPGNDFELAAGFAYGESIVGTRDEIVQLTYCVDPAVDADQRYNIVTIELRRGGKAAGFERFERHFTMNSSCGVCGRAQLDSLRALGAVPLDDDVKLPARMLYTFPERMREAQRLFASTGGLHAAALFDPTATSSACGKTSAATTPSTSSWAGRYSTTGCRYGTLR